MPMKVSIICTNYNKGSWIGEALDSFLQQQTDFPYEIIVVDDASTDDSPAIIRSYAQKYPDRIRPFFNQENKGITRTWVDICREARGQYIARCDGDDYWTDNRKLQKQVELLEHHPEARWSNTDFDMISAKGKILQRNVLKKGVIPFMDSYEKMLALKGMTMASTWLAERNLMLEVNDQISLEAVDDTFNIQLELFRRTPIAFLEDSTTVYRMHEESDSRTEDKEKLAERFRLLLQTQLEYLDKYPDSDYRQILELVLRQSTDFEIALSGQSGGFFDGQQVTVYFEGADSSFCQENIRQFPLAKQAEIPLKLPYGIRRIRVDLSEIPSFYSKVALVNDRYQTEILPEHTNARRFGNSFIFDREDPQIIYDLSRQEGETFTLSYQMFNIEDIYQNDYVAKQLSEEILRLRSKISDLYTYKQNYTLLLAERDDYKRQTEEMVIRYNSVIHSRRWRIPTKIIDFFRRKK